jgi:hypothetical protein
MVNAILFFAMGWFCGIATVFGVVAHVYRKGVRGC